MANTQQDIQQGSAPLGVALVRITSSTHSLPIVYPFHPFHTFHPMASPQSHTHSQWDIATTTTTAVLTVSFRIAVCLRLLLPIVIYIIIVAKELASIIWNIWVKWVRWVTMGNNGKHTAKKCSSCATLIWTTKTQDQDTHARVRQDHYADCYEATVT